MDNKFRGRYGEFVARLFLRVKFYRIIATNYRSKLGEIDIIASKKKQLIFVEVKFRTNINNFDQVVGNKQVTRLKNAANLYIAKNKSQDNYSNIRFDLILFKNYFTLAHYKNIWQTNE